MAKIKAETSAATLTLTITYEHHRLIDVLESAKEVIEKASEQGAVEGYLDINRVSRIQVEDLR